MAKRMLVIGLDGGTWRILEPYMQAGILPTLSGLWQEAYRAKLRSTLPAITPVAWTSLATGVNPGKHRIFGFGTYRDCGGEYVGRTEHRRNIAKPTFWRILSDHHQCARIINVPMTYPPEQIEGSIVTGMFTPGPEAAYSWPPELKEELAAAGIRPKFTTDHVRKDAAGREAWLTTVIQGDAAPFLDDVDDMTRRQHQVACHEIRKDWRLFMKVYMATDRIQHVLWNDLLPPPSGPNVSPRGRRIAKSYRLLDDCVAELIDLAGPDTTVMLVSDHGFGKSLGQFAIGRWLAERGYATFRRMTLSGLGRRIIRALGLQLLIRRYLGESRSARLSGQTFALLWEETKVFVDHNSAGAALRINTRGWFREGIVEPGEARDRLCEKLIEALADLRTDGVEHPLLQQVLRREDAYDGPYVEESPDLILVPNPDALVEFATGQKHGPWLSPVPQTAGTHLLDGICLIAGPGVRADQQMHEANIVDIAPTVLALLGVPVLDYMDGRVLGEAFAGPLEFTTRSAEALPGEAESVPDRVFSEDEQRQIEQRLRNLGYLE